MTKQFYFDKYGSNKKRKLDQILAATDLVDRYAKTAEVDESNASTQVIAPVGNDTVPLIPDPDVLEPAPRKSFRRRPKKSKKARDCVIFHRHIRLDAT